MQLGTASVSLIVGLMPKSESQFEVLVQVLPTTRDRQVLPPHLKLTILSSEGDIFREVEARTNSQGIIDDCIQLRHSFPIGSRFRIRISLENTSVTEDFAI